MAAADRARGWGTVALLVLGCAATSAVQPAVLILVPLVVLLAAMPPVHPGRMGIGLGLGAWLFQSGGRESLWLIGWGWALLLAAWFLVATLARPQARFLPRALGALAGAVASAALLLAAAPGAWPRVDWAVRTSLRGEATDAVLVMGTVLRDWPWAPEAMETAYRLAELRAMVYPALLALASLAGLAVSWFAFQRIVRREPRPLAGLREFWFRDELVWLLVAGIALLVLPAGGAAQRAGWNLVAFMAGLYALRGLGVLLSLAGMPGRAGILLAAIVVPFLYPLVMAATVMVGLTDTWVDLRGRGPSGDSGSGATGS
ncbi:MAG TPA: hypothetical protein VF192_03850 [Longimicrobiales bacterium]